MAVSVPVCLASGGRAFAGCGGIGDDAMAVRLVANWVCLYQLSSTYPLNAKATPQASFECDPPHAGAEQKGLSLRTKNQTTKNR
jgi:hypothetical protein